MKLTAELKLRAAIHLLCQANPGSTYAGMSKAVEQLAAEILAGAGPAPKLSRSRVPLTSPAQLEENHVRAAIAKFETKIQKHHRSN